MFHVKFKKCSCHLLLRFLVAYHLAIDFRHQDPYNCVYLTDPILRIVGIVVGIKVQVRQTVWGQHECRARRDIEQVSGFIQYCLSCLWVWTNSMALDPLNRQGDMGIS